MRDRLPVETKVFLIRSSKESHLFGAAQSGQRSDSKATYLLRGRGLLLLANLRYLLRGGRALVDVAQERKLLVRELLHLQVALPLCIQYSLLHLLVATTQRLQKLDVLQVLVLVHLAQTRLLQAHLSQLATHAHACLRQRPETLTHLSGGLADLHQLVGVALRQLAVAQAQLTQLLSALHAHLGALHANVAARLRHLTL